MKIIFSIIMGLSLLGLPSAHAKVVIYGSELITLPVAKEGPTIFKFNAPVKTVSGTKKFSIQPANKEAPNYAVLAITPRSGKGVSDTNFMLSDGSVVRIKLQVSSNPEEETYFELTPRKTGLSSTGSASGSGMEFSDLDLMKAMLRGDQVSGYSFKELHRRISPGFKGVEMHLVRIYQGDRYHGYIYRVENETKKKLFINIQNLSMGDPNIAVLSSVDHAVLDERSGKNSVTYLRIVAKPSSLYQQFILPIQIAEEKGKKS